MNIQTMLKHCGISATVHEFASFGGRTVQVTNFETEHAQFIRSLVSTGGFVHVPSETATAAGMLEFTNNPVFGMELADEVDPALADNTAGTGAPRGSGGAKGDLNDLGGNASARGDGRGFKVLKDGETHKFASKIFTSVLNNNDMARYGAFLYDLDHLFGQYYEEPELDDDTDDMPQRGAQPQQGGNGGGGNGGGGDLFEGASAQMDRIAELASNRSEFLKAMMKLMSGDNGERLANSFVAGDAAAFAKAFQVLADKAVAQASEQTGGDDEDEDDEGDDADADAGDGGDDSGSDSDASDDGANDADADDDDGEPNGDNAGGITDRSSSAELEARLKNKSGAKPAAPTEPKVVVRIPNNRVGDFQ